MPSDALTEEIMSELGEQLELAGARRLPDVFVFPRLDAGRRQWSYYPRTRTVRWRQSAQTFYVRSADVPFDVIPLRPSDPLREGSWFSIGPAVTTGTRVHLRVLLLQTDGPSEWARPEAARLREVVDPWCGASPPMSSRADDRGWSRYCLAAVLRDTSSLSVSS